MATADRTGSQTVDKRDLSGGQRTDAGTRSWTEKNGCASDDAGHIFDYVAKAPAVKAQGLSASTISASFDNPRPTGWNQGCTCRGVVASARARRRAESRADP